MTDGFWAGPNGALSGPSLAASSAQVVAVNAFHPGSGASTTVANVAALMALQGMKVGVVDACLSAPTLHLLFGSPLSPAQYTLNDHLLARCSLAEAAQLVQLHDSFSKHATLLLIPADPSPTATTRAYHRAYDVESLGESCQQMAADLGLDVLIIDTEAGLPPSTLSSFAVASAVLLVLALDKQQYQGVARAAAVVDELKIRHRSIAVNSVVPPFDYDAVRLTVSQTYGWDVAAVIPYCDELMALGSASLFSLRYPNHLVTTRFQQIAASLI